MYSPCEGKVRVCVSLFYSLRLTRVSLHPQGRHVSLTLRRFSWPCFSADHLGRKWWTQTCARSRPRPQIENQDFRLIIQKKVLNNLLSWWYRNNKNSLRIRQPCTWTTILHPFLKLHYKNICPVITQSQKTSCICFYTQPGAWHRL